MNKYRIKQVTRKIIEDGDICKVIHYPVYLVQMKKFPFCWITIKDFYDLTDCWWAEANAKNLLDELNNTL